MRILASSTLMAAVLLPPVPAAAQFGFIGDVIKAAAAPIIAPTQTTIGIIRGDNVGQAIRGPWEPAGRVVQQGADLVQRGHNIVVGLPGRLIGQTLGQDWQRAYDIMTASNRIQVEIATTAGRFLGGCIQGQPCNPVQVAALPLAAGLRDAYKVYYQYSSPLPPQVAQVLAAVIPPHVLGAARWTVGTIPDFTVPGFLNSANAVAGSPHAVTIGNVVIFSRMPNMNQPGDWVWLLHELRHVEQYMSFSPDILESIDGFSVRYVQDSRGMENDASTSADARFGQLRMMYRF